MLKLGLKEKGLREFRNHSDMKRIFEDFTFKSVKSWDLRVNIDDVHSRYFPHVLEFVLSEAVGTKTIQLRSRYCGQMDLFKKYSREYTDS